MTRFALDGDLPEGRLAIEASAGTGKTFTLSTLAARYVAEGRATVSELLVVTFTRAAAAELKDRVRARLVEFDAALSGYGCLDGPGVDPVLERLCDVGDDERAARRERVRRAITEFDSATITTIHGFAQQVLGTLGVSAGIDPDAVLLDDGGALLGQVVSDVMAAEAVRVDGSSRLVTSKGAVLCRGDLAKIASTAMGNPSAVLVPEPNAELAPDADAIASLVDEIISEVHSRRRRSGTSSFDDILLNLRDAVLDIDTGEMAREVLARRFRVVMIDEFQDTDPVQWEILDAIFGVGDDREAGGSVLALVGDPKQAIYAFRGANVHTYLQATRTEGTTRSDLGVNWRSDPAVLASIEALFEGATFGDSQITFEPVDHPDKHRHRKISTSGGEAFPALSIRMMDGDGLPRMKSGGGRCVTAAADMFVYSDLAGYVCDLLETLEIPDASDAARDVPGGEGRRPLRPDDVAVLVTARYEAALIRRELERLDIPAVIARGDNVLKSDAAEHWHRLLVAMADPSHVRHACSYALSWFGGRDATWVAAADDADLAALQEQLRDWASMLADSGVAAVIGRIRAETGVVGRVLAADAGDRIMTDIDHIGELLVAAGGHRPTAVSLLSLYEGLSGGTDEGEAEADQAARRVESEAAAVQIMTTFVSKGLEFPVVCVPSMWKPGPVEVKMNIWWDGDAGRRVIDVASGIEWGGPAAAGERKAASELELVGTNLRVLYVALTRARHHTAVWWLPRNGSERTGLARVLFARDDEGAIDPASYEAAVVEFPSGSDAVERLRPLIARSDGQIGVELVGALRGGRRRWQSAPPALEAELDVARITRDLPRGTRRWSFTAMTRHAQGHLSSIDPTDETMGEGGAADELSAGATPGDVPSVLPLGGIAGGAGFGTLVHSVLEHIDFTAADLDAELVAAIGEALRWSPWDVEEQTLVDGLAAVIRTPLGPLFAGRAMRDIAPVDRLNELEFDLCLGASGRIPTDSDIGAVLVSQLDTNDPMIGWARELAGGVFGLDLAGHLTGSIDLLVRITEAGRADRYVVCDYKTNRIAGPGETATGAHFRPESLAQEMIGAHYPLQALLYCVAVHRYLRWRIPDYDPHIHLGGVGYLFVRGMAGPETPTHMGAPEGLFEWHPPADAIVMLSDLLDGRDVILVPTQGRLR